MLDEKSWYPLLCTSIPEFLEAQKGFPTKTFSNVGQKIYNGKSWYPLAHIKKFCSITDIFWNTKGFSHELFRFCEKTEEEILMKKSDYFPVPYSFSITEASTFARNFQKNQKSSPAILSVLWYCDTKRFRHFLVIPFYDLPKISRQIDKRWRKSCVLSLC